MPELTLEKVGPANLLACGIGCITNPKHEGHKRKVEWLRERFAEGLRFFLMRDAKGAPLGFLEYVPGEYAWRPVDAKGWLFIHCLWVYPKGQAVGGLGSRLIQACIEEARQAGARGVAAMLSAGPWMAGEQVFLKNGFVQIAERDRFELVIYRLKKGPAPCFREIGSRWRRHRGLHIVYSAQCPYLPKSAEDVSDMAREHGLEVKVTVLRSAREAQDAPSYYGTYSLLWNGRLLSDHYVSKGRFRNLLKQEILGQGE
ncbi:MAG: GNAT family N-acetyltransferase [Planctomycetota bacterium]